MIKTIHFIFDTLINHTVAIFRQIIPFLRQKGIIEIIQKFGYQQHYFHIKK